MLQDTWFWTLWTARGPMGGGCLLAWTWWWVTSPGVHRDSPWPSPGGNTLVRMASEEHPDSKHRSGQHWANGNNINFNAILQMKHWPDVGKSGANGSPTLRSIGNRLGSNVGLTLRSIGNRLGSNAGQKYIGPLASVEPIDDLYIDDVSPTLTWC